MSDKKFKLTDGQIKLLEKYEWEPKVNGMWLRIERSDFNNEDWDNMASNCEFDIDASRVYLYCVGIIQQSQEMVDAEEGIISDDDDIISH